jgi:hypothetical protein
MKKKWINMNLAVGARALPLIGKLRLITRSTTNSRNLTLRKTKKVG